ncbi:MAG: division/cell wall cluster transcriptional repressor MraZ [Micropruina sp.]|nr:division/cell wall cluster transcriptional repressor MraZ [Micropruina sp.]
MFLGTHTPKLDDKGRFFLPAKFRDELADGLVITRQQDRCLAIYPQAIFEAEAAKAMTGSSTVAKVRDFQRMLASGASDEKPDSQGRLTVPPHLRQYASLDREIVVIGAINRIEVWNAANWQRYAEAQEAAFAEMDEEVDPR